MVLVFILLGTLIFLVLAITILLLCTLKIKIENLRIGNTSIDTKVKLQNKYEIKIGLYLLDKLPIIYIKLNNKKMMKIYNSKQIKKINLKTVENKFSLNKEILKLIKYIKIRKLKLIINIGTEDVIITSYIVAIIASIIGILLPHIAEDNMNACSYIVNPIYKNKNEYHISIDSIVCIKVVHIIYSMIIFMKKGRYKNERTSNRRSYAYRYE